MCGMVCGVRCSAARGRSAPTRGDLRSVARGRRGVRVVVAWCLAARRRVPCPCGPVRTSSFFKFCEADPDTARDRAIYMAIYYLASSMAACRANLGVAVARRRAAWRQCAPLTWAAGAAWPHQAQRQVAGAIYSTSRLCRCMQR